MIAEQPRPPIKLNILSSQTPRVEQKKTDIIDAYLELLEQIEREKKLSLLDFSNAGTVLIQCQIGNCNGLG